MSTSYSIKDLERISGIKAHTLRIWEQRYNILRPERTSTNIRYYGDLDLKRILNISLLNSNGYKISNIAKLDENQLIAEVNRFLNASQKESLQVDTLVLCLMYMDEERFENTLNNSVMHFGFENTIEKVVFPFLRHLGNMWQVGLITPAQEHYISNLIRQKLIVGLDKIIPQKNADFKTYLLFLPEKELHELGLIYLHYLIKAKGHKCLYLGQSVPTKDLVTIAETVKPDFLVSILTSPIEEQEFSNFLDTCKSKIPSAKLLLSGRLLFTSDIKPLNISKQLDVFKDFGEFKKYI